MLINAGITEIVFEISYPDELTEGMLAESGVITRRYVNDGNKGNSPDSARPSSL
jgi:deoxycytidylate deaminase